MKILVFIMIVFSLMAYGNEKYELALQYINGKIGTKKIKFKIPKEYYNDKDDDSKNNIYIKRNLKQGYKLLKEASVTDADASFKAVSILFKQIDYVNKHYDTYLVYELKKKYALTPFQYNQDVLYFLNKLIKSNNKNYVCYGAFNLYQIYHNGYLQRNKNIQKANKYKNIGKDTCNKSSYQYLVLKN